jgi:acetoin:2,6-dichlorophenolindophenol oxidoreductase subunit alpha
VTEITGIPKEASEISLISQEMLMEMYRRMVTIRKFEETVYEVHSRGVMPGLAHLYTGMEAVAVGVCVNLRPTDNITSTHRGHGHLLAKGGEPKRMFAELLGKAAGYNHGKGGSMHIVDMSLGILGANGIVAGGLGIAAGAALSAKVRHEERVSVAFFGDGALNEGLFYETANIASLWKLPVVYVMENNYYGEYTPSSRSTAGSGPARAQAMNIPAVTVDGNDILAVWAAARRSIEQARAGNGPTFIECITYRWRGHHMGDQGDTYGGYRPQEEVETWMKKDPIPRFGRWLLNAGHTDPIALSTIDEEVQQQIVDAVEFAKQAPYPDPSEVYEHVYA